MDLHSLGASALSAIIASLVTILMTGKIQSGLANRSAARRLRLQVRNTLLMGSGREQLSWWYATSQDVDAVASRLVVLADEAVPISYEAARSITHAAQMLVVLTRCQASWTDLVRGMERDDAWQYPERQRRSAAQAIRDRDEALWAVASLYRDLLHADRALAKVDRWLRLIDWHREERPPQQFSAALRYAEDHLQGAVPWQEPPENGLEALRVRSVAMLVPPPSGEQKFDAALPRRNITRDEPIPFEDPRYC